MVIISDDFWQLHEQAWKNCLNVAFCITTNGIVKNDYKLVMGKGIALEAAQKYNYLSKDLGRLVLIYGNIPFYFPKFKLISFPTKLHWKYNSTLNLIYESAIKIKQIVEVYELEQIYSPWPGCGNGGLLVDDVKSVLEKVWTDDRFVIIERKKGNAA